MSVEPQPAGRGSLVAVAADGTVTHAELPGDPEVTLPLLQSLVGGRIEFVDLGERDVEAVINEDSWMLWDEPNEVASAVAATFAGGGLLAGPVVFTGGVAHGATVGLDEATAVRLGTMAEHAAAEIAAWGPGLAVQVMRTPEMRRARARLLGDRRDALAAIFGPSLAGDDA